MAEKKEKLRFSGTEESALGNSLVVQRLGLCALIAEVLGSIPGQGTKIPTCHAVQPRTNKQSTTLPPKNILHDSSFMIETVENAN